MYVVDQGSKAVDYIFGEQLIRSSAASALGSEIAGHLDFIFEQY